MHLIFVHVEIKAQQARVKRYLGVGVVQHVVVEQGSSACIQHEHDAAIAEGSRRGQSDVADGSDGLATGARHHFHVGNSQEITGKILLLPQQVSIFLLTNQNGAAFRGVECGPG